MRVDPSLNCLFVFESKSDTKYANLNISPLPTFLRNIYNHFHNRKKDYDQYKNDKHAPCELFEKDLNCFFLRTCLKILDAIVRNFDNLFHDFRTKFFMTLEDAT
jgi:hypothetical protein